MISGYSLCLNQWALDKDIKNELALLLIISSLCAEKGYCWATNKYLADIFGITEQSISNKIKKLEEKNYIEIEYEKRGCEIVKRILRLKNIYIDDIKNFIPTIKKNFKENNINKNNININNNIYIGQVKEIIDYLNDKINAKYKSTTPKTQQLIKTRLKEGFEVADFKKVIDNKYNDWFNDPKMQMYLRPETLFGTKFENYLNQKSKHRDTEEEILRYLEEKENE